jgi:hypothetical protein
VFVEGLSELVLGYQPAVEQDVAQLLHARGYRPKSVSP